MTQPSSILITGASSGIGEALALRYAAPGIFLALTGRDAVRLNAVAEACRQRGAVVEPRTIDVTDREMMREWVLDLDRDHPLDLVIANAGISGGTAGEGENEDQARRIFEVNILGVLNTVGPLIQPMKARKAGQIAIIASLAGYTGWPGAPAYSASKGGIRLYAEGLRGSLRNTGVKVNVVCPGFVISRMTAVNDYKMPLMLTSEKAAEIIAEGLKKDRGRILFPTRSFLMAGFISFLPLWLNHFILTKLPQKPPLGPG